MNHETEETKLEGLLRGLVPDAPSPELMQRIDEELKLDMSWLNATAKPRRAVRWLTHAGWSAVGAAAAVAVMSFMPLTTPTGGTSGANVAANGSPLATQNAVLPVSTIREWEDVKNDGIHFNQQSLPEQHLRVIARDKHTWIDPRDGAEITVELPRVEKFVLPVNFQ